VLLERRQILRRDADAGLGQTQQSAVVEQTRRAAAAAATITHLHVHGKHVNRLLKRQQKTKSLAVARVGRPYLTSYTASEFRFLKESNFPE